MADDAVDWPNVQGLVLSGLGDLRCAAYVLFAFTDTGGPRQRAQWLEALTARVLTARFDGEEIPEAASAGTEPVYATSLAAMKAMLASNAPRPQVWALNIALTPSGLLGLGVSRDELGRFSDEFQKGIAPAPDGDDDQPERRSSLLGDTGPNAPERWTWGGRSRNARFDGVLLLYATTVASLKVLVKREMAAMAAVATPVCCRTEADGSPSFAQGRALPGNVGHFGFSDGISQPVIDGTPYAGRLSSHMRELSVVAAGEFVLGYKDTRGAKASYAEPGNRNSRDLALNGTYLVARQLEQNVAAFWEFVRGNARAVRGSDDAEACEWIAARLLGRHSSGVPLVRPPAGDDKNSPRRNGFLYFADDHDGLECPIGAHIRRANPRDVIGPDPQTALRLSKMHRILRRGRTYGPLPGLGNREKSGATVERGIFFLALNASIAGQFELIQHSWINNPQFEELSGEVDPLSHVEGSAMTIQSRPSNIRLTGRTPFVTVRGGAYFFMPGINALRALVAGAT